MAETVRPPSFAFEGSCSVGALLPFTLLLSGFSGADAFLFLWQTVKVLPFHLPQLRRMTLRGAPVSGFCSSHPRVGGAVLRTAGHGRALGRPFSRSPFSPDGPPPPRSIHAGTALLSFCPDPLGAMASLSCGKRSRPPLHRMAFPLAFPYVLFGECFCRSSVFSFVPVSCLPCGKPHGTSVSIVSELRVRAGRVILTICSCGRDKLPGG